MSRTVVPDILALLEPWLASRIEAWQAQPSGAREANLPATRDGKLNVRGVARDLGLRPSQEQHLFKHAELRTPLNVVAVEQGLKPIGSKPEADEIDKDVAGRLRQAQARSNDLAKVVAEQAATIERQRGEIRAYRAQLGLLEERGQLLRTEVPR